MTPAQIKFIQWLERKDPVLLKLAKKRQGIKMDKSRGLNGLGDANQKTPFWQTLAETAKEVLPSVINMSTQKKILDIQIKRAEAGLPPLEAEQYIPPIRVAAEVSPETEAALTRVAQESTKTGIAEVTRKVAPYALPAIFAWILLGRKKK